MATAVGAGFDISKLLDSITKADKSLTNLMDKSNQASKSIVTAFQKMSSQGVMPYVQSLEKNLSVYNAIRDSITNTAGIARKGFGTMKAEIDKVIVSTETLMTSLSRSPEFKIESQKKAAQEYRDFMIRMYAEMFDTIERREQQNKSAKRNSQSYAQNYQQQLSAYERLFDEAIAQEDKKKKEQYERDAKREAEEHKRKIDNINKRFELIERRNKRDAQRQTEYLNSPKGALEYARGLDTGVKSINTMNQALQQLRNAQANANLSTDEGKRKHKELGEAIQRIERDMRQYSRTADDIKNKHTNLINTGDQLKRALMGIFSVSAIKGYMDKLVDVRGEFEMQHRSLQVLIQDVDKANKLWDKTVTLAVKSPFRVKDLVTYTKQLAAYRVETDKLYDTTKMLADVSSGLGVDMNRLILAYGQVKAANFLRGTELRQFTEAGIPMLDELAKYFSEIENRAVSAADVFNRISKRGVSFEDVDAVFQRITSEGGVFYKMQEKQSETLQGMINNLRDSVDLMMNEIGQSQDSTLKNMITLTRDIVDNWRVVAVVIKQVGAAIAFMELRKLVAGWKAVSLATFTGTAAMSGAAKMGATLRLSLQKLFATMMANPYIALAAAIGAGVHAWISYNKAIKEANKQYDEASQAEMRRMDTLEEINSKIKNNNDIINDSSRSQKDHNDAIGENAVLLAQLKRDYPSIYDSIVTNTNGTIDLTNAIEEQNRQLRANIALQQQAKGKVFLDSQAENYKDAVEEQGKLQKALYNTRAAAIEMGIQLEYAIHKGLITKEAAKPYEEYINNLKSAKTRKDILRFASDYLELDEDLLSKIGFEGLNKALANLQLAYNHYSSALVNLGANLDEQMDTFEVEMLDMDTPLERGTWLQEQLDNLGILDEEIRRWAKDYISSKIKLEIEFPEPKKDDPKLKAWQKNYNKKFGDNILTTDIDESLYGFKEITNAARKQSEEIERLQAEYSETKKLIDAINKAGGVSATLEYGAYEGEDLSLLQSNLEAIMAQLDFFGADYEKRKNNEALQRLKKQISLIREAAKAYDDMRKLHDEAYASERIVSDYEDAFREAGLGDIGGYSFGTREDELNNLNKLKNSAEQVTGGMLELSKATAQVGVQVDNANKELADKRLFDAISDIFSNYEISLEMDKLNIPSDLAEKIFGFEAIDLNDIRRKVLEKFGLGFMSDTSNQEIYESDLFKSMSKERQDELRKSLEMESKLQDDALKDRLKTYTKYLREEQDERIKIKLEEIRKLEEVESMNEYDDAQKATIKANIRAEAEKDMMKKSWDSFEQSPDFLNLFDDMSKATTQSLEDMKTTLDKLKGSMIAAGLPASDLKDILDKINQVEEELENRKPFQSLKEDWSTLFGSDYKKALDDEKTLLEERRRLEDEKKAIEDSGPSDADLKKLNTEKNKLSSLEKGSEEYRQQKEIVDSITKSLYPNQERYEEILKLLEQNGVQLDEVQQKTRKWKDSCEDIAEHFIAIGDAVNQVGGALGTTLVQMGLMSEETKAIYDSYMSVADNAFNLGGNVMKLIANPTDPQAWVGAITNTIAMIGNIAATGDAIREKQIQAEMKKVDRLEKAYEKLEKAMDDAYNIDQLNVNKRSMEQNIDDQIKALESAKAKEEANKNVDQDAVDDYADGINELEEKKAELQRETVERLGGTYDYASVAEDFLDDWLTAFEETGDGLAGLEKSFDEFWKNILKKQVIYRGAADIVKNYVDSINKALENDSIIDDQEEKDIASAEELAKEKLNAYFAYMNEKYNLANLAEGELSGLQSGIQGITEEQAGILEAYWNAVRMDVSAVRFRFEDYANKMLSSDVEANPMLSELRTIASRTSAINTILESVAKNSADDGSLGIRVYMNNA